MPDYRRHRVPGGTCFLTVNLLERRPNDLLTRHIGAFRCVLRNVRKFVRRVVACRNGAYWHNRVAGYAALTRPTSL
jgi:hypothetical protein